MRKDDRELVLADASAIKDEYFGNSMDLTQKNNRKYYYGRLGRGTRTVVVELSQLGLRWEVGIMSTEGQGLLGRG